MPHPQGLCPTCPAGVSGSEPVGPSRQLIYGKEGCEQRTRGRWRTKVAGPLSAPHSAPGCSPHSPEAAPGRGPARRAGTRATGAPSAPQRRPLPFSAPAWAQLTGATDPHVVVRPSPPRSPGHARLPRLNSTPAAHSSHPPSPWPHPRLSFYCFKPLGSDQPPSPLCPCERDSSRKWSRSLGRGSLCVWLISR